MICLEPSQGLIVRHRYGTIANGCKKGSGGKIRTSTARVLDTWALLVE